MTNDRNTGHITALPTICEIHEIRYGTIVPIECLTENLGNAKNRSFTRQIIYKHVLTRVYFSKMGPVVFEPYTTAYVIIERVVGRDKRPLLPGHRSYDRPVRYSSEFPGYKKQMVRAYGN